MNLGAKERGSLNANWFIPSNTLVYIGFVDNGNVPARGHILLLAKQEDKVICFGRPFSKYVKMI